MERIQVSPETTAAIAQFKADNPQSFTQGDLIYEGSNLVLDDHLQVDTSWEGIVFGGEGGLVWFCIPAWGDLMLPIDLVDYVTDRAGPNGEAMPIFDPVIAERRMAAKTAAAEPDTTQQHGHHRSLKDALHDAVKRLPHEQQKHAREVLKSKGLLKDDGHSK